MGNGKFLTCTPHIYTANIIPDAIQALLKLQTQTKVVAKIVKIYLFFNLVNNMHSFFRTPCPLSPINNPVAKH